MEYERDHRRMVAAGLFAAAALTVEHYALRHSSVKLDPEVAYVTGTLTLGAAFGAWAISEREYKALAAALTVVAMGGSAVIASYWFDRRIEAARTEGRMQAQIGRINATPTEDRRGDRGER